MKGGENVCRCSITSVVWIASDRRYGCCMGIGKKEVMHIECMLYGCSGNPIGRL